MSPSTVAIATQLSVVESYNSKHFIALGITLVVCAVLSFTFNIVDLTVGFQSYETAWGVIGHGFWVGVMSVIAGGFGISAGCSKTVCQIVTFNVMCILTAVFTIGQFTVGLMGAIIGNGECYYYTDCNGTPRVMEILLAIFAVIEAVSAIWGSAICCKAYCCCSRTIPVRPVLVSMDNGVPIVVIMNQQQAASIAHSSANNMYAYAPPTPYNSQALPGGLPSYSQAIGLLQQQQAAGSFD